jgi:hypothetical protein
MQNPNTPRDRTDLAARTAPIISDPTPLEKDATDSGFQHIAPDAAKNVDYSVVGSAAKAASPQSAEADAQAYAISVFMGSRLDGDKRVRHEYKIGEPLDEYDVKHLKAGVHYRRGPLPVDAASAKQAHGIVPAGVKGEALTHVIANDVDEAGKTVLGADGRPTRREYKVGEKLPAHVLTGLQHGVHYA